MQSSAPVSRSKSRRPGDGELSLDYHQGLISRVPGECVLQAMDDQLHWICELAGSLSAEQIDKVHKPYTWTIRQVVEHCVDAERIGGVRMLRIAAGDQSNQPAWDENAYAAARFGLGTMRELISELGFCRQSNTTLLRRINPKAWDNIGTVDGHRISVRAMAWVTAGHLLHHLEIIEQRCDVNVPRGPQMT